MHANCKHEQCLSNRHLMSVCGTQIYSRQFYSISRITDGDTAFELDCFEAGLAEALYMKRSAWVASKSPVQFISSWTAAPPK